MTDMCTLLKSKSEIPEALTLLEPQLKHGSYRGVTSRDRNRQRVGSKRVSIMTGWVGDEAC